MVSTVKMRDFNFKKFTFDFLWVLLGHSFFFIPATTANDLRL